MDLARSVYSRDLKIAVMRALDAGSATGEMARKYQLSPKLLERWRGEWRGLRWREPARAWARPSTAARSSRPWLRPAKSEHWASAPRSQSRAPADRESSTVPSSGHG